MSSAVEALRPEASACIFAFASPKFGRDRVARALRRYLGSSCAIVVGCSTSGEIGEGGFSEESISMVSFPKSEFSAQSTFLDLNALDWREIQLCIDESKADRIRLGHEARTVAVLVIDGLSNQEEILIAALSDFLGEIQLVGGSSGDDGRFRESPLYHEGVARSGCAALTLITTAVPFEIFRTQHFHPSDVRVVTTAADVATRTVFEIDGEPAAQRYANLLGLTVNQLDRDVFAEHPLMLRASDEYFVRSIMRIAANDGLTFACAIDEGLVLVLGNKGDFVGETERAFQKIEKNIGEVSSILGFECLFRKIEGNRLNQSERQRLMNLYGNARVSGFHTFGEQTGALHVNHTLTGVAFGK